MMKQGWVAWSSADLGELVGDVTDCPRCGHMHAVEWPEAKDGMVADLGLGAVRCQGERVLVALAGRRVAMRREARS